MKTSAQIQFTVFSPITSRLRHSTVVKLYREGWQIELFFKRIKQHLHIKTFFENTRNAVFAQIWIPSVTVFCLSLLRNIIC
ncbi:transposase [Phocaeicola coprocola]|uniref:transposase n=1 Tax=Phocaeicola coprocola TaxID=310298 RepID=UPI00195E6FB3|nr:transposase [Phocaeicola coprocola]